MSPARSSNAKLYLVATAAMLAVTMWCLWRVPNTYFGMYGNFDGYWAAWNLKGLGEWSTPVDMSPFNPLSGLGSQFLPNLPWLNPAALMLLLPMHRDVAYMLSYAIYFIELSASLIFLCRTVRLSPLVSALASQVYVLLLFPPWPAFFYSLSWFTMAPVNAHLVAVCNLILAATLRTSRSSGRGNVIWGLLVVVLTMSGFASAPITFITYAPVYGLICLSVLMSEARDRRGLAWVVGILLVTAGFLALSGAFSYLAATAANSARAVDFPQFLWPGTRLLEWSFWRELLSGADMCVHKQMLLCGGYPLLFSIHALSVIGAIIEIANKNSSVRGMATGFIVLMLAIHFYHLLASKLVLGPLHVISTPYLWWASYAFIAIFLATLAGRLGSLVWRFFRPNPEYSAPVMHLTMAAGMALLAIPALGVLLWSQSIGPVQPGRHTFDLRGPLGHSRIRTPRVGAVTKYLMEQARISPGDRFKGYTVTAFGDPLGAVSKALGQRFTGRTVHLYEESRALLDRHFGNMFQDTDLWIFGIPTLEEYGQWVTNQMLFFSKLAFTQGGDTLNPFLLRALRPDFDVLQSLGVRFVITDINLEIPGGTLRAEDSASGFGSIFLYELPKPNLGGLSPKQYVVADSFEDSVRKMRELGSELGNVAVANREPAHPFVPATDTEFRLERDGFHLVARSAARSYLLVPIQYSTCWAIAKDSKKASSVTLQRANAVASLVGFSGELDARFKFEFGPPGSSRCRKADAEDYQSLVSSH